MLVIADAHFASPSPEGLADEEAFCELLAMEPLPGDTLLLVGDIYDFWFSYRHVIPARNFRATAAIANLAQQSVRVLMVGGNHDRWGTAFWNAQPGITFASDAQSFTYGHQSVFAIHGDGIHETSGRDRLLNRLIRSRAAIGLYSMIPPALGQPLGQALGHDGRHRTTPTEEIAAAAVRQEEWARNQMATMPEMDLLVMGHTHHPACVSMGPDRWYLNPGAWYRERRYAIVDRDGPRLEQFS